MRPSTSHDPSKYLDERAESVVSIAERLLSFDTSNPPGHTRDVVDWLEERFEDLGLPTERHSVDPAKPNLVVTLAGEHGDRTLTLNGHLDTVPYDANEWSYDPTGERVGGRLYGRGATDMKGPIASMVGAVEAFVETGTTPPIDLEVVLVGDEETGGDAGLRALLEAGAIASDGCVIGEPTCERDRHSVTVADRGSIWLTLEARGRAAHGSRPALGLNAIDRLYDAITQLREQFGRRTIAIEPEMKPIIEESVEYYAPIMGEREAREMFDRPTINLGTIEGGEAINSVPQYARARIDIRLTAGVDTQVVLADIRACVDGCEGVTLTDVSWSLGTYEPIDSPLVDATVAAAEGAIGDRVYRRSATGGGDAKRLRRADIPAVEFALGTETVHGVDEYITVDGLVRNALTYVALPRELADRLATT